MEPSDLQRRCEKLEQRVIELERQLRLISQRNGLAEQLVGLIRNAPGS